MVEDNSVPDDSDLKIMDPFDGETNIVYRRAYKVTNEFAKPYYFKVGYRFSLEEEENSEMYYATARVDVCPFDNPWQQGLTFQIQDDGSAHEFSFIDMMTEDLQIYPYDGDYFSNCKLNRNGLIEDPNNAGDTKVFGHTYSFSGSGIKVDTSFNFLAPASSEGGVQTKTLYLANYNYVPELHTSEI